MIYNIEDYCKRLGNRKTIAEYNIKATAYEFNKKIGMLMALYYNTNIDKDEYNKKLADYLKYYKIIPVNKTTIRDNEFLKNYKIAMNYRKNLLIYVMRLNLELYQD